jgi:hypothetical protein
MIYSAVVSLLHCTTLIFFAASWTASQYGLHQRVWPSAGAGLSDPVPSMPLMMFFNSFTAGWAAGQYGLHQRVRSPAGGGLPDPVLSMHFLYSYYSLLDSRSIWSSPASPAICWGWTFRSRSVYAFSSFLLQLTGQPVNMVFTSVSGHLLGLVFPIQFCRCHS